MPEVYDHGLLKDQNPHHIKYSEEGCEKRNSQPSGEIETNHVNLTFLGGWCMVQAPALSIHQSTIIVYCISKTYIKYHSKLLPIHHLLCWYKICGQSSPEGLP